MSTITGVKNSETRNVPMNPMRRWLPQIPTRMQKTTYRIMAIEWVITPSFPLPRRRRYGSLAAEQAAPPALEAKSYQLPVAAAPLLAEPRPDRPAAGEAAERALNFSLCALMNSR
jgi:hypothetical protein